MARAAVSLVFFPFQRRMRSSRGRFRAPGEKIVRDQSIVGAPPRSPARRPASASLPQGWPRPGPMGPLGPMGPVGPMPSVSPSCWPPASLGCVAESGAPASGEEPDDVPASPLTPFAPESGCAAGGVFEPVPASASGRSASPLAGSAHPAATAAMVARPMNAAKESVARVGRMRRRYRDARKAVHKAKRIAARASRSGTCREAGLAEGALARPAHEDQAYLSGACLFAAPVVGATWVKFEAVRIWISPFLRSASTP